MPDHESIPTAHRGTGPGRRAHLLRSLSRGGPRRAEGAGLRTITIGRVLAMCSMIVGSVSVVAPNSAAADPPTTASRTVVVDDDAMQCPGAEFASIQAAVDGASSGSMIRVCPGRYEETVTVNKSLRLFGVPELYEAIDCFAPTLPDLSPNAYPIVGPADSLATAIVLAADDVELAGFVVTGVGRGVITAERYSGYRIRHNLFAHNFLGVGMGSGASLDSQQPSRVDHNCFRDNTQGVRNTYLGVPRVLLDARIDHNSSFRQTDRLYELSAAARDVTVDHNVSEADRFFVQFTSSRDHRVLDNYVHLSPRGVNLVEANENIEISRNMFIQQGQPPSAAIATFPTPDGRRNTHILIRENTITDYGRGLAIAGPPGAPFPMGTLQDSEIVGNIITGTRQEAINLNAVNTGITIRENVLNHNHVGIHAHCTAGPTPVCAAGNTISANEMLGNDLFHSVDDPAFDAVDDSGSFGSLQNTWIDNRCVNDEPIGQLCDFQ